MRWSSRSVLALAAGLLTATAAPAQEKAAPQPVVAGSAGAITIRGFISGTFFLQDQAFGLGNGQVAMWAADDERTEDKWFLGGDVRNTRLNIGIAGPDVEGITTGATLEVDFFGGFNGAGPFSDEQPHLRMRLAYVDFKKGGTTIRIGQDWSPLFGNVPASLSHLAFPLGYLGSAGSIGWRFPGIFLFQDIPMSGDTKVRLRLAATRGSWTGDNPLDNESDGEAAGIPQLDARVDLSGTVAEAKWSAYLVGHYDKKDLSGIGTVDPNPDDDELTGTAVQLGARMEIDRFTLHGNGYTGRAIGQQFGHMTQFGDIGGWGAWAQVGYDITPRWSGWLFYGLDNPDDQDVIDSNNARLQNASISTMVRYKLGDYAVGLEWLQSKTDWNDPGAGNAVVQRSANQIALSAFYAF